jgi:hypothetical protein
MKKHYQNHLFYPWVTQNPTKKQKEIHLIREKIFNINSGTNFVRRIEYSGKVFYIIYCVSSHKKDHLGYFKFACNTQKILEIGDFAYNTLLSIFQENCENYILPKIDLSTEIKIENTSATLKNYVFSAEMLKNIPQYINKVAVDDNVAHHVIEELKVYSNTYDLLHNSGRSHLRLIK